MKALLALMTIIFSISAFASANQDFICETSKPANRIEVRYIDGVLSYENGRYIEVAVASTTNDGKIIKVSGLSKGIVFAGGGRQSVSVKVDLKTKKGSLTIYTKTFYRQDDNTQDLNCTL